MKKVLAAVVAVGLLGAVGPATGTAQTDFGLPSRVGVVVSSSELASGVGASVLAKGGNAVDAAVATAFALAVTYPFAGNIGGGGFMLVRTPSGAATSFDYRETAPGKSTATMYLDANGQIDPATRPATAIARRACRARSAASRWRTSASASWRWKDDVMPAAELAAKGFAMPASLASGLNGELARAMQPYAASVAAYGKPGGGPWAAGDTLVLPDLAKTLTAIATDGSGRLLHGMDRGSDRRRHGGARRPHHQGRPRRLPGEGAHAA